MPSPTPPVRNHQPPSMKQILRTQAYAALCLVFFVSLNLEQSISIPRNEYLERDGETMSIETKVLEPLPRVSLVPGDHKYVLFSAIAPGRPDNNDDNNQTNEEFFVITKNTRLHDPSIANRFEDRLRVRDYRSIRSLGEGRIDTNVENQIIFIYGEGRQQADHEKARTVVRNDPRYQNYTVTLSWSDEKDPPQQTVFRPLHQKVHMDDAFDNPLFPLLDGNSSITIIYDIVSGNSHEGEEFFVARSTSSLSQTLRQRGYHGVTGVGGGKMTINREDRTIRLKEYHPIRGANHPLAKSILEEDAEFRDYNVTIDFHCSPEWNLKFTSFRKVPWCCLDHAVEMDARSFVRTRPTSPGAGREAFHEPNGTVNQEPRVCAALMASPCENCELCEDETKIYKAC